MRHTLVLAALLLAPGLAVAAAAADPIFESQLIVPPDNLHVHSSSIVELPSGDLLACWYKGSGERTAGDVQALAARRKHGGDSWGEPQVIAGKPGFPGANSVLFVDSNGRLWLIWPAIVANLWETALTQYKASAGGWDVDPPRWHLSASLLIVPRNFEERVKAFLGPRLDNRPGDSAYREAKHAFDFAGDKQFSGMGWMARIHPLELPAGRVLVPLYSDGYNFSLIAITGDGVNIGGIEAATRRAETSANFKQPPAAFAERLGKGATGLAGLPGALPFPGGVPIMHAGRVIVEVGVSGVTAAQDAEVAQAGAGALPKIPRN